MKIAKNELLVIFEISFLAKAVEKEKKGERERERERERTYTLYN